MSNAQNYSAPLKLKTDPILTSHRTGEVIPDSPGYVSDNMVVLLLSFDRSINWPVSQTMHSNTGDQTPPRVNVSPYQ